MQGVAGGMGDAAFRREDFRRDERPRHWDARLNRWAYDLPVPVTAPYGDWYRWWNPKHRRYEWRRR
jgi:hypothetical protein